MELTNEVKARIFALYLGCEVVYPEMDGSLTKAILTGVSKDYLETTYKRKKRGINGDLLSWTPNGNHDTDAQHCSIRLKRISELSNEDAMEVARIVHPNALITHPSSWNVRRDHYGNITIMSAKNHFSFTIDGVDGQVDIYDDEEPGTHCHPMNHYSIGDYLRSKGYALPYMGIDLFESGIAIKKPALTT